MENSDLEKRVALLTCVVGELLAWAQEVEMGGSVPAGTWEKARLLVELEALKRRADAFREALLSLDGQPLPVIKGNLKGLLVELEGRTMELEEKMGRGL